MIQSFDHVAVPIERVKKMLNFYAGLGCKVVEEHPGIVCSVYFGDNKINFHLPKLWQSSEFGLRGPAAKPSCGDFCFVWAGTEQSLYKVLSNLNADIELGPIGRTGGKQGGELGSSIYTRDPDHNLLEFIIYS